MTAPETPSLPGPCPTDEDLAAFLDASLSARERARVVEHLARCESCYEVFAGAARVLGELGEEVPAGGAGKVLRFLRHLPRGIRRRGRWLAAAAALAVAIGTAYHARVASPPPMTVAELVAPFASAPRIESYVHEARALRGHEEEREEDTVPPAVPSFLVGVSELDLALSVAAGDVERSSRLVFRIGSLLRRVDLMEGEAEEYQAESARLTSRAALQRFAAAAPAREAALEADSSMLRAEWVDFGKWTEAGRVAAATRTAAFFAARANRRFLARCRRGGLLDLDAGTGEALRRVETAWDRGPLAPSDFRALEAELGQVIERLEARLGAAWTADGR